MNKILTFLFLCLSTTFLLAQQVKLNWEKSTVIDFGTERKTVPFFTNDGFNYENGTIIYGVTFKNTDKKKKLENLVWDKISAREIYDLDPQSLPSGTDFFSGTFQDGFSGAINSTLKISTFKYEKGQLFRLSSFSILDDNSPEKIAKAQKYGTTENPLKAGNFYKIKVDKSGVFKITTQFLRDLGIAPNSFNPKNFRIYGNGGIALPEFNRDQRYSALQEDAIQVVGEDDGNWDEGDFALFYAQGPHAYNIYNQANGNGFKRTETRADRSNNFVNVYDDYAYYFINVDQGPGKRIQNMDAPVAAPLLTRYDAYQYINEEKFNILKFGRTWTDGQSFVDPKAVTFTTSSPILADDLITYRARIVGFESAKNKVTFNINQKNSQTANNSDKQFSAITYSGSATGFTGNQLTLNISPDISINPSGRYFFDYAEVQYKEDLKYNGQQMNFRYYDALEGSGENYSFSISNASGLEQVWDVSDVTNVSRKVNKSGNSSQFNFAYLASSQIFNNEFVAFNSGAAFVPVAVGKIDNQDLSGLQNVEYLMISSPEFMGHAQRLANFYQGKYNVAVVDVNKIYNEFSSGSKDVTAIRDFATKLNTPSGTLKYIFILGDTSYDYRGREVPGSDIVPAYQSEESGSLETSFVTDDYFGITKLQNFSGNVNLYNFLPDIPVGRLPAANMAEAKLLIDKTLAYNNALPGQSNPFGEWRMKLDFVVDDDDTDDSGTNGIAFHTFLENTLFNNFETGSRSEYFVRKLYLDGFPAEITSGGQRIPLVNQAITNDVGNSLFLFYFGHGGINGWAQERVFTLEEIENFSNYNNVYSRFPLVSTFTCEFTLWDDPGTYSAGERVIKSSQGGAATMLTSSRKIGVGYGALMTDKFTTELFSLTNDEFESVGNAFLKSKLNYGVNVADHLRINLLGDPAGKLSRPKRLLLIDQIESPVPGQIRALDFVKIKGHVNKADGTLDSGFNGRVVINMFDKKITKKTLNNDNNPDFEPPMQYKEENSPIVKASGTVVNGNYTVEFYVPKDINYELGAGRVLAYADNKSFDVFNNQPQQIGGINPEGINDDEAPKIQLYMNNVNFANGGVTDANPMLLACVTDNKGINSTGSGVGHDITTYLDGEIINTIVLNDFYFPGESLGCANPNLAEYQKGVVTYPFKNLKPGPHQLTFKIWDINNNSTSQTLDFIVKDAAEENLVMNRLLNWPNPFTDKTYIQFEHNCDDILDVNVQIYTITGKLVRTLSNSVTADPFLQGYRTPRTAIPWDGKDDFGDTVGKGTYIFKVFAKSQNQDKCKGTATAVEKMVLLK